MSTSLEQIRIALLPYATDKTGTVVLPDNLLALLEEVDQHAKFRAEQMEGLLALYAGNRISEGVLRKQLLENIADYNPIVMGDPLMYGESLIESIATDASTTLQNAAPMVLEALRVEIRPAWELAIAK